MAEACVNVQPLVDTEYLVEQQQAQVHQALAMAAVEVHNKEGLVRRWATQATCSEDPTMDSQRVEVSHRKELKMVDAGGERTCRKCCASSATSTATLQTCVPIQQCLAIAVAWNAVPEDSQGKETGHGHTRTSMLLSPFPSPSLSLAHTHIHTLLQSISVPSNCTCTNAISQSRPSKPI